MNSSFIQRTIQTALGLSAVALLASSVRGAENAVLLEGFEENIDIATALGGRASLSQYPATDPSDPNVTQGTKSLQVEIAEQEFWVQDLRITFDDAASERIRQAALSTDEARYILRWDVVFPPSGTTAWMNSQMSLDGVSFMNDQLDSNNGKLTMSVALDLIGASIPSEGPISITLAQNFDATEDPFTTLSIFFDNFRLVDTYAPGATPVTYPLQSFESADDPLGGAANFTGWGGGTRTTYAQHTAVDANDNRVSEGSKSLQVEYATSGWSSDFAIPFAGTKLAEVLKLDLPEEERPTADALSRYTLRWETTYFPRSDTSGTWMNTSYQTLAQGFPWSQSGLYPSEEGVGVRKTFSITLDQLTWDAAAEGAPVMMFIANGEWSAPVSIYYDNFRLIDTGAVNNPDRPQIQGISLNAQSKIVITWTGSGTLQWSSSLATPDWKAVTGAASGSPIEPPAGGTAFYRIVAP
jgi:hypothetical protein